MSKTTYNRLLGMALIGGILYGYSTAHADSRPPSSVLHSRERATTNAASSLTAEEIGHRVLKLIDGIHNVDDISPAHLEQVFGMKVTVNPDDPNDYGYDGELTGAWTFSFRSIPDLKSGGPTQLQLSFYNVTNNGADMTPICGLDLDSYKSILTAAGFKATPRYGEFSSLIAWYFARGKVAVTINVRGESEAKVTHSCVSILTLEINND